MQCPRCDSRMTSVAKGKPPHFAQEVCAECGRWFRWLPKAEAMARGFCVRQGEEARPNGQYENSNSAGESLQ
jgi:hypothetical protein